MEPVYKLPESRISRAANTIGVESDRVEPETKRQVSEVENVINQSLEEIAPMLDRLEVTREALLRHDWALYESLLTETYFMAQRLIEDKMTLSKTFHEFFKETVKKMFLMHQTFNEQRSPHQPNIRKWY